MHQRNLIVLLSILWALTGCVPSKQEETVYDKMRSLLDSLEVSTIDSLEFITIQLKKDLLYDKYTLEDQYEYQNKDLFLIIHFLFGLYYNQDFLFEHNMRQDLFWLFSEPSQHRRHLVLM